MPVNRIKAKAIFKLILLMIILTKIVNLRFRVLKYYKFWEKLLLWTKFLAYINICYFRYVNAYINDKKNKNSKEITLINK